MRNSRARYGQFIDVRNSSNKGMYLADKRDADQFPVQRHRSHLLRDIRQHPHVQFAAGARRDVGHVGRAGLEHGGAAVVCAVGCDIPVL